jgi:hypothetical protein
MVMVELEGGENDFMVELAEDENDLAQHGCLF